MALLDDLAFCIGFFSRLPWPHRAGAAAPFRRAVRVLPFAAIVIALPAAVTLRAGGWLGLPPPVIALLALSVLVLSTGALHEDGLADCADGFGGGVTRERKLAIMKDSRIGTYGVAALALSLLLRAALLAALLAHGPLPAAMALLAAASVSRVACLLPLRLLPPARVDGLGAGLGRPDPLGMPAALSAGLAGLLLLPTGFATASITLAVGLAAVAGLTVTALARRMIGGQTGDVAGAAQQLSEIAFMLALLISRP